MKISMDKKYRTRDGRNVRLLCVDGPHHEPVVGVVGEGIHCWKPCGTYYASGAASDLDLIEYHEPDIRTIWVNVYAGHVEVFYREDAAKQNVRLTTISVAQPVTFEVKRNG